MRERSRARLPSFRAPRPLPDLDRHVEHLAATYEPRDDLRADALAAKSAEGVGGIGDRYAIERDEDVAEKHTGAIGGTARGDTDDHRTDIVGEREPGRECLRQPDRLHADAEVAA